MGKTKANRSQKLSKRDYEDFEADGTVEREQPWTEKLAEVKVAPPKQIKHSFKVGQQVTCPDKRKWTEKKTQFIAGTIIQVLISGEDCILVLDEIGLIHQCYLSEITLVK